MEEKRFFYRGEQLTSQEILDKYIQILDTKYHNYDIKKVKNTVVIIKRIGISRSLYYKYNKRIFNYVFEEDFIKFCNTKFENITKIMTARVNKILYAQKNIGYSFETSNQYESKLYRNGKNIDLELVIKYNLTNFEEDIIITDLFLTQCDKVFNLLKNKNI